MVATHGGNRCWNPHLVSQNPVLMGYMMVIQWHLMGVNGTTGAGIYLPTA